MPIYVTKDGVKYDLPESKVKAFLNDMPDAQLLDDTPYYLRDRKRPVMRQTASLSPGQTQEAKTSTTPPEQATEGVFDIAEYPEPEVPEYIIDSGRNPRLHESTFAEDPLDVVKKEKQREQSNREREIKGAYRNKYLLENAGKVAADPAAVEFLNGAVDDDDLNERWNKVLEPGFVKTKDYHLMNAELDAKGDGGKFYENVFNAYRDNKDLFRDRNDDASKAKMDINARSLYERGKKEEVKPVDMFPETYKERDEAIAHNKALKDDLNDFLTNTEIGRAYASAHEQYIADLSKEINPLIKQGEEFRKQARVRALDKREQPSGYQFQLSSSEAAMVGGVETLKETALMNKTINMLKEANRVIDAEKGKGAFWKGALPTRESLKQFLSFSEFINDKALVDAIDKHEKDPESLTDEEKFAIEAKHVYDQVVGGVDPGVMYNIGKGARDSASFMRDFMLTGAAGRLASGAVKGAVKGIAQRTGADFLLSRTPSWVSKLGKGVIDLTVMPATQSILMPSSYSMAFQEMMGVAEKDEDGNIVFSDRSDFNLLGGYDEAQEEALGEMLIEPFFAKMGVRQPRFLRRQFVKNIRRATGIQNPLPEYLEEKYGELKSILLRGQGELEDFFDPRQNLETLGVVGVIQTPFVGMNSVAYNAAKVRSAQMIKASNEAYEKALGEMNEHMGDKSVQVRQFIDEVVETNDEALIKSAMLSVVDNGGISPEAREAIVEFTKAASMRNGLERAKRENVEEGERMKARGGELYQQSLLEKKSNALAYLQANMNYLGHDLGELTSYTDENVQEAINAGVFSDADLIKWNEYNMFRNAHEGLLEELEATIDTYLAPQAATLTEMAREDGTITELTMMGEDQSSFLVEGNIVLNENGFVDRSASDPILVVKNNEGKKKQVPISHVEAVNVQDLQESIDALTNEAYEKYARPLANKLDGIREFKPNERVEYVDDKGKARAGVITTVSDKTVGVTDMATGKVETLEKSDLQARVMGERLQIRGQEYRPGDKVPVQLDGEQYTAIIMGIEDGKAEVHIENVPSADQMFADLTPEELENIMYFPRSEPVEVDKTSEIEAENEISPAGETQQSESERLQNDIQAGEEAIPVEGSAAATEESSATGAPLEGTGALPVETGVPSEQEERKPEKMDYPRDKEGNVDYDKIDDDATYLRALSEEFGEESVGIVEEYMKGAESALEAADRVKDPIKRRREQAKRQAELDRWKAMYDSFFPTDAIAEAIGVEDVVPGEAVEDERSMLSNRQREEKMGEYVSLQDFLLRNIGTGRLKFVWSGEHGLASEILASKNKESERKKRIAFLNNQEGFTPESMAEHIIENCSQDIPEFYSLDMQDIRNAINDVLLSYDTPTSMINAASELRGEPTSLEEYYMQNIDPNELSDFEYPSKLPEEKAKDVSTEELNYYKPPRVELADVSELTDDDFSGASRDVVLPSMPDDVGEMIGANGRKILIKKNVFDKNNRNHPELGDAGEQVEILRQALYHPDMLINDKPSSKPNYWVVVKMGEKYANALIDVDSSKENIEVINWYWLNDKTLESKKKRAIREGGQVLITVKTGQPSEISALPDNSFEGKDNTVISEKQEIKPKFTDDVVAFAQDVVKSHEIAKEAEKVNTQPTEGQKEAGNYQKGHINAQGFDITIENPKGSVRSGVDADGKAWETEMQNHYGYFKRSQGKDGDQIDVFIGDNPTSERVFVVDQVDPETKEFDESKVMLGFTSREEAKDAYMSNYEEGWQGFGNITEVGVDDFKKWLYDGAKQRKPFAEYASVKERQVEAIEEQPKQDYSLIEKARRAVEKGTKRVAIEKEVRAEIERLQKEFNTPIIIHEDLTTVDRKTARAVEMKHKAKERVPGWYDADTGTVHVYLPDTKDAADVQKTFFHEVVGHKGLRELLGDRFDEVMADFFDSLPDETRKKYFDRYNGMPIYQNKTDAEIRVIAAEEIISEIAESGEFENVDNRNIIQKLIDAIVNWFKRNDIAVRLADAERMANDLLKQSAENLRSQAEAKAGQAMGEEQIVKELGSINSEIKLDKYIKTLSSSDITGKVARAIWDADSRAQSDTGVSSFYKYNPSTLKFEEVASFAEESTGFDNLVDLVKYFYEKEDVETEHPLVEKAKQAVDASVKAKSEAPKAKELDELHQSRQAKLEDWKNREDKAGKTIKKHNEALSSMQKELSDFWGEVREAEDRINGVSGEAGLERSLKNAQDNLKSYNYHIRERKNDKKVDDRVKRVEKNHGKPFAELVNDHKEYIAKLESDLKQARADLEAAKEKYKEERQRVEATIEYKETSKAEGDLQMIKSEASRMLDEINNEIKSFNENKNYIVAYNSVFGADVERIDKYISQSADVAKMHNRYGDVGIASLARYSRNVRSLPEDLRSLYLNSFTESVNLREGEKRATKAIGLSGIEVEGKTIDGERAKGKVVFYSPEDAYFTIAVDGRNLGVSIFEEQFDGLPVVEKIRKHYGSLPEEYRRASDWQAFDRWEKRQELEKAGQANDSRFRFVRDARDFDRLQKEAAEKKGIVMPNLNSASVEVVSVPKHDFTKDGEGLISNAEEWAKNNLVGTHRAKGFEYDISNNAISKFLSISSVNKSANLSVHLSVLKSLPTVINESVEAEIHPDYKKKDGVRNAENGYNSDMLIHRFYGAVEIDEQIYRVKTTINEYKGKQGNRTHSYEVTNIELLDVPMAGENTRSQQVDALNNSISMAKLLQGFEKSYDKGKKLLDESENVDPANDDIRFRSVSETGFYSTVEDALEKIKQEKGTREQFKAMLLKSGAKQAEMDWIGFDELPDRVTKADIQDWIERNRIEVEEVKLEKVTGEYVDTDTPTAEAQELLDKYDEDQKKWDYIENKLNELYSNYERNEDRISELEERLDELKEEYGSYDGLLEARNDIYQNPDNFEVEVEDNTEYSKFTLPGGENYKELLLTLPKIKNAEKFKKFHVSNYYADAPIFAHVRFNERTVNGERVLFIEEVQSDWAQEGREKGFSNPKERERIKELADLFLSDRSKNQEGTPERIEYEQLTAKNKAGGVTDMPFRSTTQWVNLAMRRMMRYAAENGFDRIAWTTGEQQADRYDLSKHVDKIEWSGVPGKDGALDPDKVDLVVTGINGDIVYQDVTNKNDLEGIIGKELARKIIETTTGELSGLDLKVGGEGMKAFYDQILPKAMQKLGKPFGARVETIELPEIGTQQSILVNDKMVSSVMEGVPLFRSINQANERFNNELDAFKIGEHKGLLHLGAPGEILKASGVDAEELTLSPRVLNRKLKKHNLKEDDLKGLVFALQEPILVYKHGLNAPNIVVVTELEVNGGKLSISIELDPDGSVVEVNNIRSIHSKDAQIELARLSDFTEDELKDALRWVEKEKVLNWLRIAPLYGDMHTTNSRLDVIANIIQNFENPSIEEKNVDPANDDIRFRSKGYYNYAQSISDEQYNKATELLNALKEAGFTGFTISRSITDFGASTYVQGDYGLKYRISDHSVTSPHRVLNEIHFDHETPVGLLVDFAKQKRDAVEKRAEERRKADNERRERERLADEKWERIKHNFEGLTFKVNYRTYQDFETFRSKGNRTNILQTELGVNRYGEKAFQYEWTEPVDKTELAVTKPSIEYIEAYDENAESIVSTRFRAIAAEAARPLERLMPRREDLRVVKKKWEERRVMKHVDMRKEIFDNGVHNLEMPKGREIVKPVNPLVNIYNFAYSNYRSAGPEFLVPIFRNKNLIGLRPDRNGYPILDVESAKKFKEIFDKNIDAYEKFLQYSKYISTEAAQREINDLLDDIDYARWYYSELAEGKDVWRTENDPRFRTVKNEERRRADELMDNADDLRKAVPNYSGFLTSVYQNGFTPEQRKRVSKEAREKGWTNLDEAIEREMAEVDSPELQDFIRQELGVEMPTGALRYMLWRNVNPDDGTTAWKAKDRLKREEFDGNVLFRSGKVPGDIELNEYERRIKRRGRYAPRDLLYGIEEGYIDRMASLRYLQEAIVGKDPVTGKLNPIPDKANAYRLENQLSSRNQAELQMYGQKYVTPFIQAISDAFGTELEQADNYMNAKHGLERNRYMAEEEARRWREDAETDLLSKGLDDVEHDRAMRDIGVAYESRLARNLESDYAGLTALAEERGLGENHTEAAENIVKEVESRVDKAKIDELWRRVNAATKWMLDKQYESGMMTKDLYDHMYNMYEYYVPLRGFAETQATDIYEYLIHEPSDFQGVIKTAKGRRSKADSPTATILNMADSGVMQANRNKMKQAFYRLVATNPSNYASIEDVWYVKTGDDWMERFPDIPENATGDEVWEAVANFNNEMNELKGKGLAVMGRNKLDVGVKIMKAQAAEHAVRVWIGGEEKVIYVNGNPRAAQALNGLLNSWTDKGRNQRGVQWMLRQMSANFTSRNPAFMVTNFVRDVQFAIVASAVRKGHVYAANLAKNITIVPKTIAMNVFGEGKGNAANPEMQAYWEEFLKYGGETGYANIHSVDYYRKHVNRELRKFSDQVDYLKPFRAYADWVSNANRLIEDISRFATYVTSRQMGRGITESIADAKEVTINFNRKGSGIWGGNIVQSFFLFSNPAIQSLRLMGYMAKNYPKGFTAMLACTMAMGYLNGYINEILMGLFGGDDDDDEAYWNIADWTRRNNLVLYVPGTEKEKRFVTLMLTHELRAFYGLGHMAYAMAQGKMRHVNLGKEIAGQFTEMLPIDPLGGSSGSWFIPDIGKAPFEAYISNTNFMDRPIYRKTEWNENDPEWTKAYARTPQVLVDAAKWINEVSGGDDVVSGKLDLNPARFHHLAQGYFGGALTTYTDIASIAYNLITGNDKVRLNEIPVANKLVRTSDDKTEELRLNGEYFYYIDWMREYERRKRGYKKRLADVVYMNKYSDLVGKEDALYREMKGYIDIIKALQDADIDSEDALKLKRKFVNRMHDIEDGK